MLLMPRRRIARAYFSVNLLLKMAHFPVHLIGSVQNIVIEYVVGSALVCDFEQGL